MTLHARLRWLLGQLRAEPIRKEYKDRLAGYFDPPPELQDKPLPEPISAAPAEPAPEDPVTEIEPEAEPGADTKARMPIPGVAAGKIETRRESRHRRRELRRA